MKREDLETQAIKSVCACWYYDMTDDLDNVSDEDLKGVIQDSQYFHKQAHKEQPAYDTLEEELDGCPDNKVAA